MICLFSFANLTRFILNNRKELVVTKNGRKVLHDYIFLDVSFPLLHAAVRGRFVLRRRSPPSPFHCTLSQLGKWMPDL